jgi:hypothetical protein
MLAAASCPDRAAMTTRPHFFSGLAVGAALLGAAAEARALEPEVTSETAAQFYEMRSPTGETVIARRRLMTTLGVSVYDLYDKAEDPSGPNLSFRARLRYDADYGGSAGETEAANFGSLVPGFSRGPVDLMYGYVEGRRFLKGWLGFKVGRQYVTDALGWWSFDGGEVRVTSPFFLAAELYGGFEVRGGLPLSTPRFERDGVWRGDRQGYDPTLYPSFQPSSVAPAFGAALESTGITWLHGRLSYRRVYNTGGSNLSQFPSGLTTPGIYEGSRISQERIGYAVDGSLPTLGGVRAGLAYDLYMGRFNNLFASVDAYATKRLTLSADYDYFLPSFDADSIWNLFAVMPSNDVSLRSSLQVTDKTAVSASAHARLFKVQTAAFDNLQFATAPNGLPAANYFPESAFDMVGGGNLAARHRWGEGELAARGALDTGRGGGRMGMDVSGRRVLETRYILSGRAGVWQWNDKLRPGRDATSFGYVAGVGYKLFPRSQALVEFEHNMNRVVGQRFRVMLWLTVAVSK